MRSLHNTHSLTTAHIHMQSPIQSHTRTPSNTAISDSIQCNNMNISLLECIRLVDHYRLGFELHAMNVHLAISRNFQKSENKLSIGCFGYRIEAAFDQTVYNTRALRMLNSKNDIGFGCSWNFKWKNLNANPMLFLQGVLSWMLMWCAWTFKQAILTINHKWWIWNGV